MAFGATPKDSGNIPIGCVYIPNVGFVALQGVTSSTDGSSNASSGVLVGGTVVIQAVSGATLAADQSNTELRVSLYGKNSTAGDTALQVNSDGSQYMDLRRVAGSTLAIGNPVLTETNIANALRNGQGFVANGRGVTATNANLLNCALSIFNPNASGKTLIVYSLRVLTGSSGSSLSQWNLTTSDPGGGTGITTAVTPVRIPGVTSPSTVASVYQTATGNTATVTAPGTKVEEFIPTNAVTTEVLNNGSVISLPANNGIAVMMFVATTANFFQACAKWVEI